MKLIKLNAIDSTNRFLKDFASQNTVENFTTIWAESQTQGKGQRGSSWIDEAGKNLTFSVLMNFDMTHSSIFTMNIITAISCVQALEKSSNLNFNIKWPNDILSANKKIAGILIENNFKSSSEIQSIIGIGINVNQLNFENLPRASSLALLSNCSFDRQLLLETILELLQANFELLKTNNASYFWDLYHHYLFKKETVATFERNDGTKFVGKIKRVNQEGKLQIETENNKIETFDIKEVTLLY